MSAIDPNALREITEKIVEKMVLQMEIYNKSLAFRHPRLISQMARASGTPMPHKLVKALTRLTWMAKHFESIDDEECQAYAHLLWSKVHELAEPYTDMYQQGFATEKDVFLGRPDDDRIKVLDAGGIVEDALKDLMKNQEVGEDDTE